MKFAYIILGCPKVEVDARVYIQTLIDNGYYYTDSLEEADVVFIQTCGFITEAVEEAIEVYNRTIAILKEGAKICLVGCIPQFFEKKVLEEIFDWERTKFIGVVDSKRFLEAVKKSIDYIPDKPRIDLESSLNLNFHDGVYYLKISDGCSHTCSYCVIPKIRGDFVFKSKKKILDEISMAVDAGVREINLVAQDTTAWRYEKEKFIDLILAIDRQFSNEDIWIRVLYMHPVNLSSDVIETILESKIFINFFDIPFQHVNDRVLKSMNRFYTKENIYSIIADIRNKSADELSIIRTAFIVGFPTETEEDFSELISFLKETKLERVGFFKYDDDENNTAHKLYGDPIPDEEKEKRLVLAYRTQEEIMKNFHKSLIGKEIDMFLMAYNNEEELWYARPYFDSQDTQELSICYASEYLNTSDVVKAKVKSITEDGRIVAWQI